MKILKNAVEAIQIGLEDFTSEDPRRAQSALRNIFAGTLLLFKEKLRRLSPPANDNILIQQTIVPSLDEHGQLFFQGRGHKTVDVQQIRERFKNFGIIINWNAFDEISNLRNNIEHYYTEKPPYIVNEVVSKSFKIIRDFCVTYLNEEPSELFGPEAWNIFLETDEIYESEKNESIKSLLGVDWKFQTLREAVSNIRCPSCQSDLIHAIIHKKYDPGETLTLFCKKCFNEFDIEDVIEECLNEELAAEAHIAGMDGGDDPYADCPECGKSTYIFAEMACLNCGYQQADKRCGICHNQLDLEEAYEGDLCSYHRHSMEKADD